MTTEIGGTGYTPESQRDKVISPLLNPNFADTVQVEGVYHIDVPVEAMNFCKEIESMGGRALLVGGCVRDSIIGFTPKDYDIEVYGISPEEILDTLRTKFDATPNMAGSAFEVIKWKVPSFREPLDISIPRRDSKIPGEKGHKAFVVTGDPTMSIAEGSLRRDLTINSLAYDPLNGTLYDPHGGLDDIKNKIIRVTDAKTFIEDPVRVLRVMQFASRFKFEIATETTELCKQMVNDGELDYLTRERVRDEFYKLLEKGVEPSRGFEFARKIGFVEKYWPELNALIDTPQNPDWHPEGSVWNHTMQVIDAACEIAGREIAAGRMNKDDRFTLIATCLLHDLGKPSTTEFLKGAIRSYGHEEAGVEPSRIFLERIFGKNAEVIKPILPMIAEHLKPKEMWINEVKKGIRQRRALHRLTDKLAAAHASVYLLSLVAEADQRGRSAEGHYFARVEVPELAEWQSWLTAKMNEDKIENRAAPKILSGGRLLQEVGRSDGGPWVGIIVNSVQQDYLDEKFSSPEQALELGIAYYQMLNAKVKTEMETSNKTELDIYGEILRIEDPRSFLQ